MKLSALQTDRGFFNLVALDQPFDLATGLGLALEVPQNQDFLSQIEKQLLSVIQSQVSGLGLEPRYSLPVWLSGADLEQKAPLILRVDNPQANLPVTEVPQLSPDWGISEIKNNYAAALLQLAYDPAEANAIPKKRIIAEIADSCRREEIPLILKLSLTAKPETWNEAQLEAIQELRTFPDVLALQVPEDALAIATLTAELDIPWVVAGGAGLATPTESYDHFKAAVERGLENGARGFLVGSALWADIYTLRRSDQGADKDAITGWITNTLPARLHELSELVAETVVS